MDCISFSIYFQSGCIKHEPRSPPSESVILPASYGSSSSRRSTRDSEPSLLASCFSFSIYWLFEFPVSTFIVQHHCCGRTGERTPLVPLQACAGWAETVNSNAHLHIFLPQNRCLPHLLAAPFPRQPEPRCNTLDFASKVVC